MSEVTEVRRVFWRDISATAAVAGFLAVLVSYAGPLLIYLQAAQAMDMPTAVFSSWVFAISIAAGLSSITLSAWFRAPIAMAWSAPGTVLLISIGTSLPLGEVVGAYLLVATTLLLLGLSGWFERLIGFLPPAVTNGMMAGILFGFGLKAARSLATDPFIFATLLTAFVVLSVIIPRYALLCLVGLSMILTATVYDTPIGHVDLSLAAPGTVLPEFSMAAILGLALPLFITTLSGQFLPGMAILRSHGYATSARPILIVAGAASLVGAFFGGVTTALASITAAFCAGPECHENPSRRYIAGVACGVFFCLGGIFSGAIVNVLILLPSAMISILAGLALLGAIQKSLSDLMMSNDTQVGLLTFLVTTSGVTLGGIGSAFWGVVVGLTSMQVIRFIRRAFICS
ncbi:benzoate membrane transport protein [Roseovarius marisflavi]|uniref:Benzoate membrane transport protein n=1 Tax=Roseovarius marisflavi TaxID=1054996 RepID=A0A1M7DTS7_9RHOB|nr:benzoate/H(+) symporter BenE family transporter [Roseovarius marisflavi]SHL82837.1 benzoate membrane transport protein [Roseovarius marisflavi]